MSTAIVSTAQQGLLTSANGQQFGELVALFLSGRKATTLTAYRASLDDFARSIHAASAAHAASMLLSLPHGEANHLALRYRSDLIERGLAASTVNLRLAALRSLVKLARTLGLVAWSLGVQNVRSEAYRDTKGPGPEGFRQVLSRTESRADRKGIRDAAIVRLLHDLALRRAEVVGLDVEDVDLDGFTIAVTGKGKTEETRLTLPVPTATALRIWLDVRGDEDGPLFTNVDRARKGNRLTGRSVHRFVKSLGDVVGLRARPHGLRHSGITAALDLTNGDILAAQRFARHVDPRTTLRYDDNREDIAGQVARLVAGEEPRAEDHSEHSSSDDA